MKKTNEFSKELTTMLNAQLSLENMCIHKRSTKRPSNLIAFKIQMVSWLWCECLWSSIFVPHLMKIECITHWHITWTTTEWVTFVWNWQWFCVLGKNKLALRRFQSHICLFSQYTCWPTENAVKISTTATAASVDTLCVCECIVHLILTFTLQTNSNKKKKEHTFVLCNRAHSRPLQ